MEVVVNKKKTRKSWPKLFFDVVQNDDNEVEIVPSEYQSDSKNSRVYYPSEYHIELDQTSWPGELKITDEASYRLSCAETVTGSTYQVREIISGHGFSFDRTNKNWHKK